MQLFRVETDAPLPKGLGALLAVKVQLFSIDEEAPPPPEAELPTSRQLFKVAS